MTTTVNPATGEVAVELGGQTFRLRATFYRLGEMESQFGVDGLPGVQEKLQQMSGKNTLTALKCLCVSDNADALDDLLVAEIGHGIESVYAALAAGLPPPKKKPRAVKTATNGQQLPGPDSELSPLAS